MSNAQDADLHDKRELPAGGPNDIHSDVRGSAFVGRNVALWWRYFDSLGKPFWRWNAYTPTYNTEDGKGRMINGRSGVDDRATAELEARNAAVL